MRITFIIEALTSGGGQRQMIYLAKILKSRLFHVTFITYHLVNYDNRNHFMQELETVGIPVITLKSSNKIQRLLALKKAIELTRPDLVISFLFLPNMMCELLKFTCSKYRLIVSERTGNDGLLATKDHIRFQLHRFADVVVFNSSYLSQFVLEKAPWLKAKSKVITNCVDLNYFCPPTIPITFEQHSINILVIGRFRPEKNPLGLLKALDILRKTHPHLSITVNWYGNNFLMNGSFSERSNTYLELKQEIEIRQMESCFIIHPPLNQLQPIYQQASLFCLPSIYESFPNALCEALASGLPIVASNISNNNTLVIEGRNGYLFDPKSPESIAKAILQFSSLSPKQKRNLGRSSRQIAELLLDPEIFAEKWITLINEISF